jgi:DNA-binding LacI/PurR family transcriptional regulator
LIERRAGAGTFVRGAVQSRSAEKTLAWLGPLGNGDGAPALLHRLIGELAGSHGFTLTAPEWRQNGAHGTSGLKNSVRGAFVAPGALSSAVEGACELLAGDIPPIILLDHDIVPHPRRSRIDLVGIDHFAAGHMLAEHLLKLGCQELRFVDSGALLPSTPPRLAGIRDAVARRGLDFGRGNIHTGDPRDARFGRTLMAGRQADAFLCDTDATAYSLMRTLRSLGYDVPRHARVAAFDDRVARPDTGAGLTTMGASYRDLAAVAFRALLERLADRDSCGAYLRAAGA